MADLVKIQKLLNLCASESDAEALLALRQVQKMVLGNLGDYFISGVQTARPPQDYAKLYDEEAEKARELSTRASELDKKLRKRENDNTRLKRDNKALKDKIEEIDEQRLSALDSLSKRDKPGEYEILEKLYGEELEKNERLKSQLEMKDKSVKKGLRDVTRLKRGKGSDEGRVEELETMVNDLALEVMDLRDKERARNKSTPVPKELL
ncbi:MAG: hypothetical protein EOP10_16990 [Proteobacteria bacterium]|nr:MAG: hypothetical protein EOP10_16990 [Pseudomonadota bacterium]